MRFPRPISWSVLVLAMVYPTVLTWLYFVVLTGHEAWLQRTTYSAGKAIQFALTVVWIYGVLRLRPTVRRPTGRELLQGGAFGLAVLAAMLAAYWSLKPYGVFITATAEVRAKVVDMQLNSVIVYAGMGVFYALFHSFLEEYYWRWFVFGGLRSRVSFAAAMCVSSLGFMAHHVIVLAIYFGWSSPLTYLFSAGVAVGGAAWAWLYERTDGLYGPWLSHLIVDAAIFLIGYDMVASVLR